MLFFLASPLLPLICISYPTGISTANPNGIVSDFPALIVIGTVVLILGGTSVGDINPVIELVFGIIEAIGLLVIAIGKLLQKKATTNK